jgi:hypothetical protein
MVTLSKDDVKILFDYLNEQPTKFSVPVMNFINQKIQEQQPPQDQAANQEFKSQLTPLAPDQALSPEEINKIDVVYPELVPEDGLSHD